ncbi:MAG TPA: response regulator [Chloroflexi bacterium]|nr:response regulator [Chloroflexota bacterium]
MENHEGAISILLVDDNLTFVGIARRFLEAQDDIVVISAVDGGDEALERALELKPDIILIDITSSSLPGGLNFIPRLREALPGVGIIALTLLGTDGYRRAALEAGVDEFVPKANMGADLLSAIRRTSQIRQAHQRKSRVVQT